MKFILRMLCVSVLGLSVACSRIEWPHWVSKSSISLSDGGRDAVKWNELCLAMGKTASCDVCSELGWYEDSACDAFCPSHDSVCPKVDPTLVGHWRLDEESGRIATDSSASRNDGTYAGMPTPTAGKFGRALEFHGRTALQTSNDRIILGDPTNDGLDFGTSSFSVGLWVNVAAPAGSYDIAFFKGGSNARSPGYEFELGEGAWVACICDGDENLCDAFTQTPVIGRWVHLMAVVDRGAKKFQLYVDGNSAPTPVSIPSTFGSVSSTTDATIGAASDGTYPFKGLIDDVRLYRRALDAAEVYQLQQ